MNGSNPYLKHWATIGVTGSDVGAALMNALYLIQESLPIVARSLSDGSRPTLEEQDWFWDALHQFDRELWEAGTLEQLMAEFVELKEAAAVGLDRLRDEEPPKPRSPVSGGCQ